MSSKKMFLVALFISQISTYGQLTTVNVLNKYDSIGRRVGKWAEFYENGATLKSVCKYTDGVITGWFEQYNKKGKLKYKSYYIGGRSVLYKEYHTRGKKNGQCKKINGFKIYNSVSLYSYSIDSTNIFTDTINSYKDGLKNGFWFEHVIEQISIPIYQDYYAVGFYCSNKRCGTWRFYKFETKELVYVCNYNNNFLDGPLFVYNDVGLMKAIINYKHGKINGKCTSFYNNGQTATIYNFNDGKMAGEYFKYNKSGKLKKYIKDADLQSPW